MNKPLTILRRNSMQSFLRDLMAHADWANAVFFHAWGNSPARDHEDLRRRVGHMIGVQQGFLSILRGQQPGGPPSGPPPSFEDLKTRAETCHAGLRDLHGYVGTRDDSAYGADTLVSGPTLRHHDRSGAGASGDAHAAPSRAVHDPAEGLRG
jgi:hypothetical protein